MMANSSSDIDTIIKRYGHLFARYTIIWYRLHHTVKKIHFINKLLVIGYCRAIMNTMNIPDEIICYCCIFIFYVEAHISHIGIYHTLDESRDVLTCHKTGWSSSFIANIVTNGRHYWTFKIKSKRSKGILLGIWKSTPIDDETPINDYFWRNNNGYGYRVGCREDHNHNNYGIKCKQNDIISMVLDMNNLSISFKVNDIGYGILCKVDNTTYMAAICAPYKNESVELVSYNGW